MQRPSRNRNRFPLPLSWRRKSTRKRCCFGEKKEEILVPAAEEATPVAKPSLTPKTVVVPKPVEPEKEVSPEEKREPVARAGEKETPAGIIREETVVASPSESPARRWSSNCVTSRGPVWSANHSNLRECTPLGR